MPRKLGSYDVYGTLGKGEFTRVRFAVNKSTNFTYAMKIVDKKRLKQAGLLERIKNEIAIMKMIECKYCVGIRDMFSSSEKIFIVVDIMMGGSLFHRFKKRGKISENKARYYFHQLLRGVEYCHSIGIVNGGLSLEGILLDGEGGLKISSFDWAVFEVADLDSSITDEALAFRRNINESMKLGAPHSRHTQYFSPERVENAEAITRKSDIWSMGVILFAITAGYMPFEMKPSIAQLMQDISLLKIKPYPEKFSHELKFLLEGIFVMDPLKRPTIADLKVSPWLIQDQEQDQSYLAGTDSDCEDDSASFHDGNSSIVSHKEKNKLVSDEKTCVDATSGWSNLLSALCMPLSSFDMEIGGVKEQPPHAPLIDKSNTNQANSTNDDGEDGNTTDRDSFDMHEIDELFASNLNTPIMKPPLKPPKPFNGDSNGGQMDKELLQNEQEQKEKQEKQEKQQQEYQEQRKAEEEYQQQLLQKEKEDEENDRQAQQQTTEDDEESGGNGNVGSDDEDYGELMPNDLNV